VLLTPVDIPFAAGGSHDLSLNRNMIKLGKGDRLHLAELQKIQISKKGKFAVTDVFGGRFVRVVSIREKDEDLWKKRYWRARFPAQQPFQTKSLQLSVISPVMTISLLYIWC